jgi:hypothetical protein
MLFEKKNVFLRPMNAKNAHIIYIILLLTGLFAGACHDEEATPRLPGNVGDTLERTIIFYMAAENSLNSYMTADSVEIAWGTDSLPEHTRAVLFLDDVKSSRLCVGMRGLPLQTVKTYEGNICSTDSQSMVNIFHDILRLYPARSYGLVMCSHASGWLFDDPVTKARDSRRRSFGIDNGKRTTANQGQKMNIPTLAGVLEGCTHFDYVMFDACFMQCIEVAYELRHTADYIIASPAEIPGTGAPFTKLMRLLAATPTDAATAAAIAERYASEALSSTYRGAELSVIRTDRLEHLAQATAPIMQQLLANAKELNTYGVQHYYPDLWSTYYPAFYDMKHLLYAHLDSATYAQWDRVFEEAVPTQALTPSWYSAYNWGSQQYLIDQTHTGGVSIYIPRSTHKTLGWIDDYHRLQWYKDLGLEVTNW